MALISGAAGRLISGKRDARNTKKEHKYSVEIATENTSLDESQAPRLRVKFDKKRTGLSFMPPPTRFAAWRFRDGSGTAIG
jgi:hypothetical protein